MFPNTHGRFTLSWLLIVFYALQQHNLGLNTVLAQSRMDSNTNANANPYRNYQNSPSHYREIPDNEYGPGSRYSRTKQTYQYDNRAPPQSPPGMLNTYQRGTHQQQLPNQQQQHQQQQQQFTTTRQRELNHQNMRKNLMRRPNVPESQQHKCKIWVPSEAFDKYPYATKVQVDQAKKLELIEVCCPGFGPVRWRANTLCRPLCENCRNGFCAAPDQCECFEGFVANDNGDCVFTCPLGCLNGRCYLDGTCQCDAGYKLDDSRKFCRPICSGGCGMNPWHNCTEPDVCGCARGYKLTDDGCQPTCQPDCGPGGYCREYNVCQCGPGYTEKNGACQSDCYQKCDNGICYGHNRCICNPGYTYHERTTQCIPM